MCPRLHLPLLIWLRFAEPRCLRTRFCSLKPQPLTRCARLLQLTQKSPTRVTCSARAVASFLLPEFHYAVSDPAFKAKMGFQVPPFTPSAPDLASFRRTPLSSNPFLLFENPTPYPVHSKCAYSPCRIRTVNSGHEPPSSRPARRPEHLPGPPRRLAPIPWPQRLRSRRCQRPTRHLRTHQNVAWKVKVFFGQSSRIVFGNRVFLSATGNGSLLTLAYDLTTGREL